MVKLMKPKDKGKILRVVREKDTFSRGTKIGSRTDSLSEIRQAGDNGVTSLKTEKKKN